jgi:uncharacterized repeat protein (TIGR01451 family)
MATYFAPIVPGENKEEFKVKLAKSWQSHSWLFWTSLFLMGLLLVLLSASGFQTSQAAAQLAGEEAARLNSPTEFQKPATVEAIAPTDVITSYAYLPIVYNHFALATLTIDKSVSPATVPPTPGEVVTYSVTITNSGDTTGQLLTIYDTLPAGFTFLGMADGSDIVTNPSGNTGQITWHQPLAMAPGQVIRLRYRVSPSTIEGQYTNYVNVTAAQALIPPTPASATVTVEPAILLQEDFNNGIDRWTPFLNGKRLEPGQWYWGAGDGVGGSGALTHDCCVGDKVASDALMMYLGPGAEQWTDYRVETRIFVRGGVDNSGNFEPDAGDPIGFWIRGQYEPSPNWRQWVSGYYVVLVNTGYSHYVRISQMQIPGDCEGPCYDPLNQYTFDNPFVLTTSAELPGGLAHFYWYTLAVEVRGNRIQVWLDGQKLIDYVDTVLPFMTGTIGFKVHETKTASFDDVIVTRLP